jgi:hypothetical protein
LPRLFKDAVAGTDSTHNHEFQDPLGVQQIERDLDAAGEIYCWTCKESSMAAYYACSNDENSEEQHKTMRDMFGPQSVDQAIRQAISTCWMVLPDDKKNVACVEAEIRRIVDRALENLREDSKAFGIEGE